MCGLATVAPWIEQRFPKPRALVRFRPGALSKVLQEIAEAAALVDSYLARADTPSRLEQLEAQRS
jgi:hypothetical protein